VEVIDTVEAKEAEMGEMAAGAVASIIMVPRPPVTIMDLPTTTMMAVFSHRAFNRITLILAINIQHKISNRHTVVQRPLMISLHTVVVRPLTILPC
jgi:hypothetical protein